VFDFRRTIVERVCKNKEEKRSEDESVRNARTVSSCPARVAPALQLGSLTKILLKAHMPQI
jgi:hypothetical protein